MQCAVIKGKEKSFVRKPLETPLSTCANEHVDLKVETVSGHTFS
jgi:hypothetical protein